MCVISIKEQQMLKNPPNFFTYKIKYHVYNQYCQLYIYSKYHSVSLDRFCKLHLRIGRGLPSVKMYIHPAKTHRLLKFLFHIMGGSCRPIKNTLECALLTHTTINIVIIDSSEYFFHCLVLSAILWNIRG